MSLISIFSFQLEELLSASLARQVSWRWTPPVFVCLRMPLSSYVKDNCWITCSWLAVFIFQHSEYVCPLLSRSISDEKSADSLMGISLQVTAFFRTLAAFKILSLSFLTALMRCDKCFCAEVITTALWTHVPSSSPGFGAFSALVSLTNCSLPSSLSHLSGTHSTLTGLSWWG